MNFPYGYKNQTYVDNQCTASKDKPDVCLMSYVNKLNPDILIPFTFQ